MGNNILQLLATILVFVLVLAATYYATRWIAKSGAIQAHSKNIRVIETFKIAPNKYIQIIKLGAKYYSIAVTKDHISFLTPLEEEQLDLQDIDGTIPDVSFKDVMSKVTSKLKKKDNKE